jgi:hypothetical protein
MTFKIGKTSDPYGNDQPAPGAVLATPEIKPCRARDVGHMACDCGRSGCYGAPPDAKQDGQHREWTIEINSLEQLLELVKETGHIVISEDDGAFGIEVYDDYRE